MKFKVVFSRQELLNHFLSMARTSRSLNSSKLSGTRKGITQWKRCDNMKNTDKRAKIQISHLHGFSSGPKI